jgi:hypothetical protein
MSAVRTRAGLHHHREFYGISFLFLVAVAIIFV